MSNKRLILIILSILLFIIQDIFGLDIIKRDEPALWNDTVRVAIIWNDGTTSEELESNVGRGKIGEDTKNFLLDALTYVNNDNIEEYFGDQDKWDTLTLEGIKNDFGGKLPHVIAYVNAGYEWAQFWTENKIIPVPKEPYDIISEAANNGVGIVAIGDDAAFDAKKIFPLTGPNGIGEPVQYDYYPNDNSDAPIMGDATEWTGIGDLWIWLDRSLDEGLPDGGLLWALDSSNKDDSLWFNPFSSYSYNTDIYRVQADADIWDVDKSQLDDYSFIGYQQGSWGWDKTYSGNTSKFIGNTPKYESWPNKGNGHEIGSGYEYIVLAALQQANHRIVMTCFQPQYLNNEDASGQILYNSIFWASKAHAKQKITTPIPDPLSGSIHDVNEIKLSVLSPKNTDLYEIYFTLDGSTPNKNSGSSILYDGTPIKMPVGMKTDLTLKAIAFSEDTSNWLDSDMLEVTYEYTVAKISTPVADPDSGNTQSVTSVSLSVSNPTDQNLYKIIYSFDESDSLLLNGIDYNGGKINLPNKITTDVTLYAKAIPVGTDEWLESNIMKVVYEYAGGPLIDSALFLPGKLADLSTSERENDTLIIWFNTVVKPIDIATPFLSKDSINNEYLFHLDLSSIDYDSLKATFIVDAIINKPNSYIPQTDLDSISIDPLTKMEDLDGIIQDGSNNFYVPLKVGPVPYDLTVKKGWLDIPNDMKDIIDIEEGALLVIDLKAVIKEEELEGIQVSMSIFDMLGNEVIGDDDLLGGTNESLQGALKEVSGRNQLFIVWNGENSLGRRVGSASYLAKLNITDHENETTETSFMIGVPGKMK